MPASMPTTTAPSAHGRVETLDLLRLFAALAVLVYHFSFRGAAADGMTWLSLPAITPITKYGFLGVELFFVISGFVIAWSAEGRNVRQFVIARAARIYPGFLFCMTLSFVVLFLWGAPEAQVSFRQWAANLIVLSPALKQPFMDGVYWSIVYELVFYGWVTLAIATGFFQRRLPLLVLGWLGLSLANELFLGSGAIRRVFLTDDSGFFSAGIMLYMLHGGRRTAFHWLLLGAAAVIAAFQANMDADWVRQHFSIVLPEAAIFAISFGAIALVAGCLLIRRIPLPARVVLGLGGLTYPLYLIHEMVGFTIFNRLQGVASPAVLAAGTTAAMLLLAWAVYRFVERPGQRLMKDALRRWLPGRDAPKAAAASTPRRRVVVFGPVTLPRAARS